ncbi:hypothetical protein [Geobacter sp. SVR]|uniref:hypothetical protein n=1 Tax=Geobacter sp. SVR TaxID=2495594 RepID=UPI00143EF881|nr:hypothetical protein [Geobacter sp. SVR]BCS54742.1 hypothetical protein GSVR_30500 [Geobacter sp. SVR]GCF86450.1 hypothetical protein GSbR_30500 [Geobacter sp. SVR]
MRIIVVVILINLLCCNAMAASPGPKDGFRDIYWGDAPLPDMLHLKKEHGMDVYSKSGQLRDRVASIDNGMITYHFYNKKFCRVEIMWPLLEYSEANAIHEILKKEWGKPEYNVTYPGKLIHLEWMSENGRTRSSYAAMKKVDKKEKNPISELFDKNWLASIFIDDKACVEKAISDNGL